MGSGFGYPPMYSCTYIISTEDILVVLPDGLPLMLWREVPLTGAGTIGMVLCRGGYRMAVTVLLGAQLLAMLCRSFSARNHTCYP